MRRSFTLIELIFSMVIIAIAFTVLPKILQLSAKVSSQSLKEEALYSGVALMGYIKATAWDEENTKYDDILIVQNGVLSYDCNNTRRGGFIGSRNCRHNLQASTTLGLDGDDNNTFDDIDDFSSVETNNYNRSRDYNLSVKVNYVDDIGLNDKGFKITSSTQRTNTKYVQIDINSTKPQKTSGVNVARLKFWMFNIGQIHINRIPWYE